MNTTCRTAIFATIAFALSGMVCASQAAAQCGSFNSAPDPTVRPDLREGPSQLVRASLRRVSRRSDPIVGFWKAKFLSEGTSGIPDGALIDAPFVQLHSDGTEIMNSSRVPATQSFCLGVWQKTGDATYSLNHFALSFDTDGKTFVGPTQIRESITLSDRDHYTGSLTIDQFDPRGNLLAEVKGSIAAIRVTVDTNIAQVL